MLEIHRFPDRILSKTAAQVENIDGRMAGLLNSMVDTMFAANGIGLAAPQVGRLQRAIVMDHDTDNRGKNLIKLINPVIVEASGEITTEEGCLSVVNYTAMVTRASKILLKGWTPDEKEHELEYEGLQAVCIQHEIDHLEGKLFIDQISRLKRDMYRKRILKAAKTDTTASRGDKVPRI